MDKKYKPSSIDFIKGRRHLDCLGLSHIYATVKGEIYNESAKTFYNESSKSITLIIDGKQKSITRRSLLRNAFKFDEWNPDRLLNFKDKDIEREVILTWEFYNQQKNIPITEFKCAKKFINKLYPDLLDYLFVNDLGLYNTKYDRYYAMLNTNNSKYYKIQFKIDDKINYACISCKKLRKEYLEKVKYLNNKKFVENNELNINSNNSNTNTNKNIENSETQLILETINFISNSNYSNKDKLKLIKSISNSL